MDCSQAHNLKEASMQVSILATMSLLKSYAFWVETCFILHTLYCSIIVSSPDLIRHVYRFQYNARELKAICAGVGLGLGPRLCSSLFLATLVRVT